MAKPDLNPAHGPSMVAFWDVLLQPLIDALGPRRILEIGADTGITTRALVEYAESHGAVVHSIDPRPQFDVEELKASHPEAFVFHQGLSLDVLPTLETVDLALVDGDHNWHTVLNELKLLESSALDEEARPPLVALHDIAWPYGRRDLYYDPDNIPEDKRRPFQRRGIHPDSDELVDDGLNSHLANATVSAAQHSGVRGGIDDFLGQSKSDWRLYEISGQHGLGVLATEDLLEEHEGLRNLLEATREAEFLRSRVETLERARIDTELRRVKATRDGSKVRAGLDQLKDEAAKADDRRGQSLKEAKAATRALREMRDELDDAKRRARRFEKQRDALGERELALEEELAGERRKARVAQEEVEVAEDRHARDRNRLAELQEELKQVRTVDEVRAGADTARHAAAELRELALEEELAGERRKARVAQEEVEVAEDRHARDRNRLAELQEELKQVRATARANTAAAEKAERRLADRERELEKAVAARSRLVADFEEAQESLERTVDEVRAGADTARHAAAELREMLEERELVMQRVNAQLANLQTALGRARARAQVAEAERSALESRLSELAKLHEVTLRELGAAGEQSPATARLTAAEHADIEEPVRRSLTAEAVDARATDVEREARRSFATEYRPATAAGADPMALPSSRDRRRILIGADDAPSAGGPSVDVVVCVHDALDDVRRCLWSLIHKSIDPFHLIVVNDGSDAQTTAYLEEASTANPEMTLIDNQTPPHGYAIAADIGMRAASGDYVVLLNSDTIVTSEWLTRIVACGESDERIGILGPLSNAASHQSVPRLRDDGAWATNPLPSFVTEDGITKLLDRLSPRLRPRLPFINGFCYVIKRAVIDAIGYFDLENFASGYCEENDFSYRAAQAGFELAVVDDSYVFHAKSKSYTAEARQPIARRNYEIFLDKHGREEIQALVSGMEKDSSLGPLRNAVGDALSSPRSLAAALDVGQRDPLNVVFILPGLGDGGSGGSHSIYQEVKGLRELGVPARILLAAHAQRRAQAAYDDAGEIFQTFADTDELTAKTADANVISATHFKSIAMLAEIRSRRDDFLPAYYVQDYEPFLTAHESGDVREAVESYTAIQDCLLFAKTHWLCNVIGHHHGLCVEKVEPSIDERLFVPPEIVRGDGPLRVAAMVRPRTPRRQPTATLAVLEQLRRRFGATVEIVTFGCAGEEMANLTDSTALLESHCGILTRQDVAKVLARSDVFLDMSLYQAFGRTALEAMACGCTAIVPRLGGVWEFVVDGENACAVDTLDPVSAFDVLAELVTDRDRVRHLQEGARRTAAHYSIARAALSEYLLFSREYARRFDRDRAAA